MQTSETVQRLPYTGTGEDDHGNEIDTWGGPVNVDVYGFDPGSTSEPREPGHDRVIVTPTLYGPFDMPFQPHDRCVARGDTYEVDGVQRNWRHPNGNTPGAVVTLRKVAG